MGRTSAFGERIAHGMLVVSFAVGLVPLDPERVIALRRVRDAVFRRPVRLGDTIHVSGRVANVRPAGDDAGLVTLAIDVCVRTRGAPAPPRSRFSGARTCPPSSKRTSVRRDGLGCR